MSIYQFILILLIFKLINTTKTCFQQSNHINYLFLNDISQIKIPLIPLNCFYCQSASYVDIQLIDEEYSINRTIQHIKIFLKNFEIEDSSYICLRNICPIYVEYGNDKIILNITSLLFSHIFLSLIYFNQTILCSIQTRFAIYSLEKSLICTKQIYLHPQLNIHIIGQFKIYDCQIKLFYENIYQKNIQFFQNNFLINYEKIKLKSSDKICEYLLEYQNNLSLIHTNELSTIVMIYPFSNPWNNDIQTLGPCQTKIIQYQEMFFTDDIVNIRNIYIEKGQTIHIQCPINGSEKYLKYIWYYQRYQPKYQISTNRTIILNNITEQMQGKYICIGDDENEKLEFEMTLHLLNSSKTNNKNSFYVIIILILLFILILFCLILTFFIYFTLKKSSSKISLPIKSNSLTIHHNILFTIQHLSEQQSTNSLWNQTLYHTLDYIDDQTIHIPSWSSMKQLNSEIKQEQIPYRFSTRQRNVNRQLSMNIPLIQTNNLISNEQDHNIEILKISLPLLTQYPLIKSSSSIISFDSQTELDEFNQMSLICIDNE